MTANGITETRTITDCSVDSFSEDPKPFVLDQTPAVFSVGMRCMKQGYTFVWPPGEQPFMINKDGLRIDLHSKDDIPYLIPGEGSEPHKERLATDIHNLINQKVLVADVPAVAGEGGDGDDAADEVIDGDDGGVADEEGEDDGMIEVDVHEGEPRLAKPGALKAEAKTIAHLLTHRYKNPFCQSCIRAKMKHFKTYRGAFKRTLKKWGDLVTFDFADLERNSYLNACDDKELLVIRDRFTGMIQSFPMKEKDADNIVLSIKRFAGNRKIAFAYSDQAPQFVKACKELKITLDTSVPGRKVTNSLAERNIQFLVGIAATCLLEAGLPACYWSYAVSCVSHLLNIEELEDGSAWQKMHKEKFTGPAIPFGAKVVFKPSDARKREQSTKFDPKGLIGVFAGYVVEAGQKWSRKMLVWNLVDFKKVNLAFDCEGVPMLLQRPHITERVELLSPITFPLKSEYERMNGTIEGVNSIADRDGNPEIGDRYEDDDAERDGEDDDLPKLFDEDDLDDDDDGGGPPHGGGSSSHRGDKDIEHVVHRPIHFDHGSAGDGIVYHNDDGEWVKLDRRGRPYRVDRRDGRKIMRTSRPKDFTPEEWKSLGHEHRKALAEEYKTTVPEGTEHEEIPKESEDDDKKKKKKKKKKDADDKDEGKDDDVPKGPDKPPEDVAVLESVTSKQMVVGAASSGCYGQGDSIPINTIDENANWVEWEEFVQNMNPAIASVNIGAYYSSSYSSKHSSVASIPSMPCVQHMKEDHRERLGSSLVGDVFRSALVSRPVGRKEMLSDPEALESMMKEWKGQWTADVYDFKTVREYDDVVKEAYKNGEEIHMARVHGICVEKHSELPKEDKRRKFKGRGVLLGNQVKNQNFEAALFQDLGNSRIIRVIQMGRYVWMSSGTQCSTG